ncbi:hypothetical protein N7470_005649 [Penicillium chermesinum]|nr:hypothetical protein N7470_005649 [Penicillium chermesinum]
MAFAAINSTNGPIAAIEEAFATEPSLKKRVYDAIDTTPQHAPLFEEIARYTSALGATSSTTSLPIAPSNDGPAAKKRKTQNGAIAQTAQAPVNLKGNDDSVQFYVQELSFTMPQRKKTHARDYWWASSCQEQDQQGGGVWDIAGPSHALCLPVPEKTQKQFNFCIIPEFADGITPPPEGVAAAEAMVFTVAHGPAKTAFTGLGQQVGHNEGESAEGLIRKILNDSLPNANVICPDERQFVSATPEAHRKGEKAFHVKAFRGSKEGYLFFLSVGILFAFKKPLLFFSFDTVDSISYTSVLQRTFNLNILARPRNGSEDDNMEFEFSMIDQADFDGIDQYIKRHGLQDSNPRGEAAAEAAGEEPESELQKAQRELEDEEEEDEEDYDPGSDDSSDGSGSSDEESDDDDDQEDGEDSGDEEMQNELGSEAEENAEQD